VPTEPNPPAEPVEPVDPDVDLRDPAQKAELNHHHPLILGAIALGGVIGAEARYGLGLAIPHAAGAWPWATLLINLSGSLLLGALMAALAHGAHRPHRGNRPPLTRPFFGVGVLGGFTTFSTYAVDLHTLLGHHHPGVALAYLTVTLVGAVLAVTVGAGLTRAALTRSGPQVVAE
jgi:fluoride exporter